MILRRFMCVLLGLAFILSAGTVFAAEDWYTCDVKNVAVKAPNTEYPDGAYVFQFTDVWGAFTGQWFFVTDEDTKKGMMAICLTAIATDRRVVIYADTSLIQGLYMVYIAPCQFATPCQ